MTQVPERPRRLIEVDLPIRRISEHAVREKSKLRGHISTLHLWWARRPNSACRSVTLAALCPDPADSLCSARYRAEVTEVLKSHRERVGGPRRALTEPIDVRNALLDFVADFANAELACDIEMLASVRALVVAGHRELGGDADARPLVVDPFAGGGTIPLEALRMGADAFASDLNSVPVLLNKILLDYIPRFGTRLAAEVQRWGERVLEAVRQDLALVYSPQARRTDLAYIWARTIRCEGPSCGAEIPLMRSLWLAKRCERQVALRLVTSKKTRSVSFEVVEGIQTNDVGAGTIRQGAATCPVCGFTTPNARLRAQLVARRGGTDDARLLCVVSSDVHKKGRLYRLPEKSDLALAATARARLTELKARHREPFPLVPEEEVPQEPMWKNNPIRVHLYGMTRWSDLFTSRQLLSLATIVHHIERLTREIETECKDSALACAVSTCLAMVPSRCADYWTSLTCWIPVDQKVGHTFSRQALAMVWDFVEASPFADIGGSFERCLHHVIDVLNAIAPLRMSRGTVEQASATSLPLPDHSAAAIVTDPPYYDAVPYAYLSDFFYIWLRRSLHAVHPKILAAPLTEKARECVYNPVALSVDGRAKDGAFFQEQMRASMAEAKRVTHPDGIGVVVFAHKSTAGWEAQLQAMIDAGWTITGSWPLDTERPGRLRAHNSATLASSIHLVCRPRVQEGATSNVGEWRAVLNELPARIGDWTRRLAEEGIVGADAIFACIGPALEIYSRYGRVEKASGEIVTLREYLEQIWGAVAKHALSMIFRGADATGFEEDARLTAIWFWVLKEALSRPRYEGNPGDASPDELPDSSDSEPDEESNRATRKPSGYILEFDAARKLAQGLGVDLERLARPGGIITIRGATATLNNVRARERALLSAQLAMFDASDAVERLGGAPKEATAKLKEVGARQRRLFDEENTQPRPSTPYLPGLAPRGRQMSIVDRLLENGTTTLDRLHQAMLLFARSQSALLGTFLEQSGVGRQGRFWQLAQALSSTYPPASEEKRWVDGVLARKKGLGF
jgi:putative DNA methylase